MDDTSAPQQAATRQTRLYTDLYANHLYLADYGRGWAAGVRDEASREPNLLEAEYLKGYAQALADMAEHLEAGEGLPGSLLYTAVSARIARSHT